ncbi:hypothetical protein FA15DRAFT_670919 [Coprinopsis marcescibilis]|uniref:RING-14 protein n=1 Tax=Coprinopsis marcescibilis TaxID=230819 RepID=A0A5C3L4E5_COPMA|nr:hypothetical protein FA15DRAFT_670919 [Coprinopsis marcescibilis]
MHFSKTYTQILQDLPLELRENAIQYRQLKKLINQVVSELSSLGLSPSVLQDLIVRDGLLLDSPVFRSMAAQSPAFTGLEGQVVFNDGSAGGPNPATDDVGPAGERRRDVQEPPPLPPLRLEDIDPLAIHRARVMYELIEHSDRIEPHLRLWIHIPDEVPPPPEVPTPAEQDDGLDCDDSFELDDEEDSDSSPERESESPRRRRSLLFALRDELDAVDAPTSLSASTNPGRTHEVIIPLVSDTKFFSTLSSALESMSAHFDNVHEDFSKSLSGLSRTISSTALPASSSPSFHPLSALTSHAGAVQVTGKQPPKSDLYSWREIFQLYVESEIFEHVGEVNGGERSVAESEKRLKLFVDQATQRGLATKSSFKSNQSRKALRSFIELNLFILNIKKFSEASSEATRKILKKHTKRTALPLPTPFAHNSGKALPSSPTSALSTTSSSSQLAIFTRLSSTSLPRLLVQAIGETLLPIIPHVDDYACLICTGIAFKPIRLSCGHLFCVRCLVKMQKRGNGDCPMCRAPVVLGANGSNVDWGLMNFMQDWFPVEAKEKLKSNEREATEEQLIEMGIDPDRACVVM